MSSGEGWVRVARERGDILWPMTRSRNSRIVRRPYGLGICAVLWLTSAAAAQQQTFTLDPEQGEWQQTEAPEPGSDAEIMQRARTLLAQNRPGQARRLLDGFLEKNERLDNPWLAEAFLLRGDAKTADADEYDALYDYEEVIKSFPGTEQFAIAVEREMDIGIRYLGGLKRKFLGLRIDSAYGVGEELLIRVQERLPGSRLAERAGIELADYYYRRRDLKMAAEAYDVFLRNFPQSQYRQKAMQRRIYSNIGRFKGPSYDASGLVESEILIKNFADVYPADAEAAGLNDGLLARLDESAAAQMLDTARWYLRRGDPISARLTIRRLLRKHPASVAAVRGLEIAQEQKWDLVAQAPDGAAGAEEAAQTPGPSEPQDSPVPPTEPQLPPAPPAAPESPTSPAPTLTPGGRP